MSGANNWNRKYQTQSLCFHLKQFSEYKLIDNALETSSKAVAAASEVLSFNSSAA